MMQRVTVGLVAVVAILVVIDLVRRNQPVLELRTSLQQLDGSVQQLTQQQQRLRDQIAGLEDRIGAGAWRPVADASGADGGSAPTLDGKPRLGANFLLPYDRSAFDPDRVGGEYRFFDEEPSNFNDLITSMAVTANANDLVNDTLCDHHPLHPELWSQSLATSVVIEDDYRTFTFTIRDGVYWQVPAIAQEEGYGWLGEPVELTAHDFVFYLDMLVHPEVESSHLKAYYQELEGAEALDDHTLRVTWSEKQYTNLDFSLGLQPLPRHVYRHYEDGSAIPEDLIPTLFNEHWFDQQMQLIGVGMYTLEEFKPGEGLRFRRNPTYWGATHHFETVFWDTSVKDRSARLVAFKNNQVHTLGLQPNQYRSQIVDRQEPRFEAPDGPGDDQGRGGIFGWEVVGSNAYGGICWNLKRPELADRRVRQALAYAYPSRRVIDEIYFGLGEPKRGPVHPSSPYYNDDLPGFPFDLDRASELLDAAGWVDSDGDGWRDRQIGDERLPLRIEVTYFGRSKTWGNMLSLFRDELRGIGVDLVPSPVEAKTWEQRIDNRDFDGLTIGWRSGLSVDFMQLWHSKGADDPSSSNYAGFKNAEVDRLAEALRDTFDLDERIAIAQQAQAIIQEQQPYLFVRSSEGVFAWHNKRNERADEREVLGGVTWGLDHYHPLFNRDRSRWYFQRFAPGD